MGTNINKLGEINYNKHGSKMTIVEYTNSTNFIVEFENSYRVKAERKQFDNGTLTSPYDVTVYGVGYMGEGNYKSIDNGVHNKIYRAWSHLMRRSYNDKYHKKFPTYIGCSVCEEWFSFQNFAKWFEENYYEINNERMELDKDILCKGNKIYSPETCVFAPNNINTLFTKRNALRGNYPIGVHLDLKSQKLHSQCRDMIRDKKISLGSFDHEIDAFNAYKTFKEKHIKEVADLYKDKIPQKLYDALYRYEVQITD